MSHKTNIIILFRKKAQWAFSVEEIFRLLIPAVESRLKSSVQLAKLHLPNHSNGLLNKIKNIIFLRRYRSSVIHVSAEVYYAVLFHPKTIITIHDIALALSGPKIKRALIGYLWYKLPARRA